MPRNTYDAKTKAAIIAAASDARKAGKTWAEALEDAKKAGYAGSLQGITKMMRTVAKKAKKAKQPAGKRRGRKPGPKAAVNVAAKIAKRGPGRPPKAAAGMDGIEAMVSKLVESRVKAVLDKAIAVLKTMRE